LIKLLNRTGPDTEPWGTAFLTGYQLDLSPFTTTLWAWPSSEVLPSKDYTHPSHEQLVSPG